MQTLWDKACDLVASALTFGINPSLEPMHRICELMGNPQENYVCAQVAGTNGKSSTCRYLAALLHASGAHVGLYTSPELVYLTDRVEIDGNPIDEETLAEAIIHVHDRAQQDGLELTEFELITAAALWVFAKRQVDYVVLEAGLGGRWDATSVVHPKLAVLTGVDLDHTAILGNTITEIAGEKAAIIKEGTAVVVAPTKPEALAVFRDVARKQQASWTDVAKAPDDEGSYQAQNKLTALTAFRVLCPKASLNNERAYEIMDATVIPGRLEKLSSDPLLIIDAAHNPASASLLTKTLVLPDATLLLGILADKDARGIIEALVPHFARIVVTQTDNPRAIPVDELALMVEEITGNIPQSFATPAEALDTLLMQSHPIVATGSITVAGAVKRELLERS